MMTKKAADKPILSAIRYAVVVTDKGGTRFVLARVNGHLTVRVCTPPLADDIMRDIFHSTEIAECYTDLLADDIMRDIVLFHSTEIAECYRKDAVDLVKRDFGNNRICPRPPFKAEVVPLSFKLG